MKVYGCENDLMYGGGLILVAANTIEEAYLTAATDDRTSDLFHWVGDEEPNFNYYVSATYPLGEWREIEHLSTDLSKPQVIIENHYSE